MVERRPLLTIFSHAVLLLGVAIVALPIYVTFIGSTHDNPTIMRAPMPLLPGPHFLENYRYVLARGGGMSGAIPVWEMLRNSLVMAVGIAGLKIFVSILSAYAVVYFRFPFRMVFFWMIFVTLMLPVEVRILPTFEVVAGLGWSDTYAGLIIPIVASATATFLFRQFFLTIPEELAEAARIDGAGPLRFFWDVVLPLSRTNIAALFVILFIYGWNQYLWPLLITDRLETVVIGINRMLNVGDASIQWNLVMATTMLAMIPPVVVVLLMQRWFVKGLVETEK